MEQQLPEPNDVIEARFRALVERLPAIVYLEDASGAPWQPGALLYVSPQLETILGYRAAAWIAEPTTWRAQMHPDDIATARAAYERANAAGAPYDAEYRMFAHDGRIVRLRDEAVLVRDEAGAPLYWQGIMYDVTAEREGEIRALEAEARYRTLVEQLPAIVYSEDITGDGLQVVYINPRVQELLGIAPEEWVADPSVWMAGIHPDDRAHVDEVNRTTEQTGEPFSVEYRMFARDGRTVWFRDEAVLVYDATTTASPRTGRA